jgi:hypothetical protein
MHLERSEILNFYVDDLIHLKKMHNHNLNYKVIEHLAATEAGDSRVVVER